jgi:hypothetical protein
MKIRLTYVTRRPAMAKNVVNFRPFQLRVDGYDNSPRFQTAEVPNGEFRPIQKVKRDPVS